MDNFIFNAYLKFKTEYSGGMLARIVKLPRHLLTLFFITIISAIVSIVLLFMIKNPYVYWIPAAIEIVSVIALGICSNKYNIDNNQKHSEKYIEYCRNLYKDFCKINVKTEQQFCEILNRTNKKISDIQTKIDKNIEITNKWMQTLIIPILLAVFKAFIDSEEDISVILNSSFFMMILTIVIYAFIIFGFSIINYDIKKQQNELKNYAEDLQSILDIMVTFKIADNMQSEIIDNQELIEQ